MSRLGPEPREALGACLLKLLGRLGGEFPSTWHPVPCALLAEACAEARLHVVPERLPRDIG